MADGTGGSARQRWPEVPEVWQALGQVEVDYIVPIKRGGDPWALDGLQTLCEGCHCEKTRIENRGSSIVGRDLWLQRIDELCR